MHKTHPRASLAVYGAYKPKRIFFEVVAPRDAILTPLQTYDLSYGPKDEEFYAKHLGKGNVV